MSGKTVIIVLDNWDKFLEAILSVADFPPIESSASDIASATN